jgi:plastocyanin
VKGDFGKRVLGPALIPLGAFVFIGALVFAFSRILLAVPKDGSVIIGILMAGCVLFGAAAVAKGAAIKSPQRAALVAFSVLLLAGGVATGLSIGTRTVEGHLEVAAKIVAQNIKFDKTELDLPADKPFILEFDNKDATVHNVAIYKDPSATDAVTLFKGALEQGPKVAEYEVKKPLPKGVWFFRCDVHPVMNGTARVGGATGPGPGGPPSPAPSGPAPEPSSPKPSAEPTVGTTVSLVAKGLAFDKKTLEFVANALVVLTLDNQDPTIPHDFALYRDAGYTQEIFKGDPPVTGPAKGEYRFPAPGPGTYYFQCDFHPVPQMRGTVTVR